MGYNWYRTQRSSFDFGVDSAWMCAIPSGSTYRRVRFSWGFAATTDATVLLTDTLVNVISAGLVTTIGNGSESVPNAISAADDGAPPTQRWVWWESRQPVVSAIDQAAGVIAWRDSGPQEIPDVKVNVLATGIPGGDTLNLWFSWASTLGFWDTTGGALVWVSTAVLYSTP